VKLALKADHYRDRELFFRLTGSLPDKKGTSINILNQPVAAAGAGGGNGDHPGAWLETADEFVIEIEPAAGFRASVRVSGPEQRGPERHFVSLDRLRVFGQRLRRL